MNAVTDEKLAEILDCLMAAEFVVKGQPSKLELVQVDADLREALRLVSELIQESAQ